MLPKYLKHNELNITHGRDKNCTYDLVLSVNHE